MKTCTLSTLVADTGETPRTLNSWSDLGILRALRATEKRGRGRRRHYPAEPLYGERKYALLASALIKLRIPHGEIRDILEGDRALNNQLAAAAERAEKYGDEPRVLRQPGDAPAFAHPYYEDALAGAAGIFMLIVPKDSGPHPYNIGYLRIGAEGYEAELAKGNDMVLAALAAAQPAAILLNLSKIFAPLYSNPEPVEADDEAD